MKMKLSSLACGVLIRLTPDNYSDVFLKIIHNLNPKPVTFLDYDRISGPLVIDSNIFDPSGVGSCHKRPGLVVSITIWSRAFWEVPVEAAA